ncbi:MAG TPA: M28 family peptidase [Burkholderiales bacterium]|nr:M28 family peptidase [Burkholderiales bacterium]
MKSIRDSMLRMLIWLSLIIAIAWLVWYAVAIPGSSYRGPLPPLNDEEKPVEQNLRQHVVSIATREHHYLAPAELEAAARYIEERLRGFGYVPAAQRFSREGHEARNIEVELAGTTNARHVIIVGAHYDSVVGAPGANDNGSGVAALIELARLMRSARPAATLRFVAFVDEEPPFFQYGEMGSERYARRCRERGEQVTAMFSLETIGYYSSWPGSQHYPPPLQLFYPSTGNFIAFVANLRSRALLHRAIAAFRRHAAFPSEGVAAPAFLPGVDWSDHASFWEQGYPALMITDTALYRYPDYHAASDTPDKLDYERLARVVAGLERMLRELSGADAR